jgi:hypothetical protein
LRSITEPRSTAGCGQPILAVVEANLGLSSRIATNYG